jgi:hypothetical protein
MKPRGTPQPQLYQHSNPLETMSAPEEKLHIGLSDKQHDVASDVDPVLLAEGLDLVQKEKTIPFKEAFKHHWRALLWGMVLSLALVMDGYDGSVVSPPSIHPPHLPNKL